MKLAHARSNEMGTVAGGMSGDQTGSEVVLQDFFEYDWTDVFRPINADKIAEDAKAICRNDHIGYDQRDRYGMYLLAKSNGWNFKNIVTPCSTDCSQMVATLAIASGINVSPYMYTGNEIGQMEAQGVQHFKYTSRNDLRNGDFILSTKRGHTATVIGNGSGGKSTTPKWVGEVYGIQSLAVRTAPRDSAPAIQQWPTLSLGNLFDVCDEDGTWWYIRIAGQFYGYIPKLYCLRKTPYTTGTVSTALHLRQNAGAGFKSLGIMPKGAVVQVCDTKPARDGRPWVYCIYDGKYGFASAAYIK